MIFKARRRLAGILGAGVAFATCTAVALAAAGSLTWVEQNKNNVGTVLGMHGPLDVAVAPGGANVYAVANGSSAVVTFSRTAGALTWVEQDVDGQNIDGSGTVNGIGGAFGVAVSPDGANVYVTGHADAAVATFRRESDGKLTFVEQDVDGATGGDSLAGAWGVTVSPDGANVYVASDADNAVTTFKRESDGTLTFVERDKDGVDGDGLLTASGVAVAPGGASVYVASCGDNAVAAFSRDATTGALTFVEQEKQDVNGVGGLACARDVTVDGSGANVYVASENSDAVATFKRDPATSALEFVEQDADNVGGVDGLNGARGVTTSPDCGNVYVTGRIDSAVAVFSRDPVSGALSFVEQAKNGVGTVNGIATANAVAVSPDGANTYAVGETDDAVATFTREASTATCNPPATDPNPTPVDPDPAPVDPTPVNPGGGNPAARTITFAASKTKVKKGKQVTLSGDLSAPTAAAACDGGQAIEVQRMPKGTKEFTAVTQVTSAADGTFSAKLKAKKTAQYRATVAATTSCVAATSPATTVKVKKKKRK